MKKIITRDNSKNSFIREGSDWNGKKFSKQLTELCLRLENWIEENPEYIIDESWSDFQPSYSISGVRKKPLRSDENDERIGFWKSKYYPILEVFPRVIGYGGFYVRDNRLLSPINFSNKLFSEKFFTFDELIMFIQSKDYGIDVREFMRIKNVNSFSDSELTDEDIEMLKSITL